VSNWEYWWSFTFIQYTVYAGMAISVAILAFLGISAGVVARRTKHGGPKRLTVERWCGKSGSSRGSGIG
jgi:hypothetical protein